MIESRAWMPIAFSLAWMPALSAAAARHAPHARGRRTRRSCAGRADAQGSDPPSSSRPSHPVKTLSVPTTPVVRMAGNFTVCSSANLLWACSLAHVLLLVAEVAATAPRASSRPVIAPTSWDVIGPFPASAREQGADALSAFAPEGVMGLPRGGDAMYPSELASEWAGREAGKVGWSVVEPSADDGVTVNIDFGDMRWDFMQAPFGSSVRRATGWAIGDFDTQIQPGTYAVVCQGVSWFLLDGDRINGDVYRTGWRGIQPVMLQAGQHTLHVPFTTSGSTGSFSCSVSLYETDTDELPLEAVLREGEGGRPFLFADLVGESGAAERTLVSTAGSVVVENRGVEVLHDFYSAVLSNDGSGEPSPDFALTISPHSPTLIQPRQQLPLRFEMEQLQPVTCGGDDHYPMRILVRAFIIDIPPSPKRHHAHDGSQYKALNGTTSLKRQPVEMTVSFNLTCREYGDAFVFTFPDADETVQYAAARSPAEPCPPNGCAVMFSTHGAGVDADPRRNSAWAGAYRRQEQAWLLWPTNRDDFGYDWQMIGYQNGMKALEYLVDNLPGVPSQAGNRADPNRLLYSGHSMGGHGCLEYLTHHGDRALGAVPAAGWISMELYTFDKLRTGDGWIDPTLRGVLYSALGEWDTDLYVSNAVGIPLLMRLGGNDTSVPPWHLRRFARLLDQASTEPLAVGISEVAGQGHWWDSIMDDDVIAPFYAAALQQDGLPSLPQIVEVVTLNPATTTGRGGVRIEQLRTPYRLARASIDRGDGDGTEGPWVIVTQNVRRLSFYSLPSRPLPAAGVVIDGSVFIGSPPAEGNGAHYCISEPASVPCTVPGVGTCNAAEAASEPPIWRLCDGDDGTDWTLTERSASNYGPLRQVFHTAQIFLIYGTGSSDVAYNDLMRERARFIANTAYYQGRAAITILDDMHPLVDQLLASDGQRSNVIVLGGPDVNRFASLTQAASPIVWEGTGGGGRYSVYRVASHRYGAEGLGWLSLAPLKSTNTSAPPRLLLFVAGSSMSGFELATTLVPLQSGLTLPDFIMVGPEFRWKGAGGVVAAGFLGNDWQIDEETAFLQRYFSSDHVVP